MGCILSSQTESLEVEPGMEGANMQWITPEFDEIDLSCEINSYANAEL